MHQTSHTIIDFSAERFEATPGITTCFAMLFERQRVSSYCRVARGGCMPALEALRQEGAGPTPGNDTIQYTLGHHAHRGVVHLCKGNCHLRKGRMKPLFQPYHFSSGPGGPGRNVYAFVHSCRQRFMCRQMARYITHSALLVPTGFSLRSA